MAEGAPQTKQDEQYPLLKVDGGGGDGSGNPQHPPALGTPGWNVTCVHKPAWIASWPEYISACWMTIILLGISFLVFYSLGMEAYGRRPVLLIKCNSSKPASDVFYHQIIAKGNSPSIMPYAEYLSSMAYQYPLLHFHVYFLIDDSEQNGYRVPRHPRFIHTLIPMTLSNTYPWYKQDDTSKRDLEDFQRKHRNINVTVMLLSKYMAMTRLKYKWRNIPLRYLPFYARVFSVWQYGGVGIDLCTFNNYYNNRQYIDRRISAILRQHNDGIKTEEYKNALNKIDREEENELFSTFYGLIYSLLNETRTFLSSFPLSPLTTEIKLPPKNEPLIRVHRNKRESPTKSENNSTETNPAFVNVFNFTNSDLHNNNYQTLDNNDKVNNSQRNNSHTINLGGFNNPKTLSNISQANIPLNKTDNLQVLLVLDSVFTNDIPLSFAVPEALGRPDIERDSKAMKNKHSGSYLLSLDTEGVFIASTSRFHFFLGHLLNSWQQKHPKIAIQDAIRTQCSGMFEEDVYCNNIYLL